MAWVWMRVRMSVRLGWQDTAQTLGRLIFGLLVAVVATALAIVVFRQPGALHSGHSNLSRRNLVEYPGSWKRPLTST